MFLFLVAQDALCIYIFILNQCSSCNYSLFKFCILNMYGLLIILISRIPILSWFHIPENGIETGICILKFHRVRVLESPTWKQIGSLQHPRAQDICFSPMGNYLAVWDTYASKNMFFFSKNKRFLLLRNKNVSMFLYIL